MDDDPGNEYIEKFRGCFQWSMKQSKDFVSGFSFEFKKKNMN